MRKSKNIKLRHPKNRKKTLRRRRRRIIKQMGGGWRRLPRQPGDPPTYMRFEWADEYDTDDE
jgi:hypothetical protein